MKRRLFICKTNVEWQTKVPSDSNPAKSYAVRWSGGWHCSCKAFQYGGGTHCKHVIAVIASDERCAWNKERDPDALPNEGVACPKCGGEIVEVGAFAEMLADERSVEEQFAHYKSKETDMSQALEHRARMMASLAGEENVESVNIAAGIVKLTFKDGSMLDFTHPEVVARRDHVAKGT